MGSPTAAFLPKRAGPPPPQRSSDEAVIGRVLMLNGKGRPDRNSVATAKEFKVSR